MRNTTAASALHWRPLWQLLGAVLTLAIVFLSLTPAPPGPDWPGVDKIGHLLMYGILTGWYAQLYSQPRSRLRIVLACIVLGASLEVLQPLLAQRYFEWWDLLANSTGAGLAWLLCRGPAGRMLHGFERWIQRR